MRNKCSRLDNTMRSLFEFILKKIKGGNASLDKNIPIGSLIRFFMGKAMCMVYGMLRLMTMKRVFIHPTATIRCSSKINHGKNLNIERGCFIDALSKDGLVLGDNVSFGYNTCLRISGAMSKIGNGIKIGNNVGLGSHGFYGCGVGSLTIGDDCIFGNYVSIHPENHNYRDLNTPIRLQGVCSMGGVFIGNNCWVGAKATILDGTKIGNGCIVAAGAVVKGEFPDNVIIGGIPAKIIKHR